MFTEDLIGCLICSSTAAFPGTQTTRISADIECESEDASLQSTVPKMKKASPLQVVQSQLDAYNRKDVEGILATYAGAAEQFALHGERLACGHEQMRQRFLERFAEPDLEARLLSRVVVGNFVVDLELVTRNFTEGLGTLEMLCIYEVSEGCVQRASFATGAKKILAAAAQRPASN